MPELPEVETTCRGVAPHLLGEKISAVVVRQPQLRWPVSADLAVILKGTEFCAVTRRAKYLLFRCSRRGSEIGTLIVHLGMSGSLRIVTSEEPLKKHDHLDICFGSGSSGKILRYSDPRRFGAILWHQGDPATHKLLDHLGPEPLSADFDIDYLVKQCRSRAKAIKQLIMEQSVVVGVGNIYASEALFMAGIDPRREAGRLSRKRLQRLLDAIKAVLEAAIAAGGTTLRDFVGGDGKPGYFSQELQVYGREGEPCLLCEKPLKKVVQGQRATFFCPICQK